MCYCTLGWFSDPRRFHQCQLWSHGQDHQDHHTTRNKHQLNNKHFTQDLHPDQRPTQRQTECRAWWKPLLHLFWTARLWQRSYTVAQQKSGCSGWHTGIIICYRRDVHGCSGERNGNQRVSCAAQKSWHLYWGLHPPRNWRAVLWCTIVLSPTKMAIIPLALCVCVCVCAHVSVCCVHAGKSVVTKCFHDGDPNISQ